MNRIKFSRPVSIGFVLISAVVLGVAAGVWVSNPSANAQQMTKSDVRDVRIETPKIPGSPILISSPASVSTDAYKPSYALTLTNVGTKPIRAYTLKSEIEFVQGGQVEESSLAHMVSEDLLFRPNRSRQEINNGTGKYSQAVSRFIFSIDFVEYADGTTWGKDVYHSAESLAGERAGGQAAIAYYKTKVDSGSFNPDLVESDAIEILQLADKNKSEAWRRGFQSGVGIVRNRLQKAAGSMEEVRQELNKPFDASFGRKAP